MPVTERTRARPALNITTPSLTRHVIVFFPARQPDTKKTAAENEPLNDETTRALLERYVDFLLEIAEQNKSLDRTSAEMRTILCQSLSQHSSFGICLGRFLDLRLRVLIVLYTEHFTLTYILDNDHVGETDHPLASRAIDHVEHFASFILDQLSKYAAKTLAKYQADAQSASDAAKSAAMEGVYKITASEHGGDRNLLSEHGGDRNLFLNDVIFREVWVASNIYLRNNIFVRDLGGADFSEIMIGDTRGLAITASHHSVYDLVDDDEIFTDLQRPDSSLGALEPGRKAKKPSVERSLNNQRRFFAATLGLDASLHYVGGLQPSMKWDSNAVLCYVSDKSAIYGSSLVLLPERGPSKLDAEKIRSGQYDYARTFIIFDGNNNYKLGRLVRRLHVLADLRAMAFVERREVASAHDALRELGREAFEVIDNMTGKYGVTGSTKDETLDTGRVNFIIDNFNKVGRSKNFNDNNKDNVIKFDRGEKLQCVRFKKCHGGLSYRIGRSKYYYESYRSRIEDLSVADIKGFQSYHRFVLRNYNQQMQSILSIEDRNFLLGARIDRAISIAHTLQQRKVTQYAIKAALLLSMFPALGAIFSGVSYYRTWRKVDFVDGPILGPYAIFIIIAILLLVLWEINVLAERKLKSDGLFVKIENKYKNNQNNIVVVVARKIRLVFGRCIYRPPSWMRRWRGGKKTIASKE